MDGDEVSGELALDVEHRHRGLRRGIVGREYGVRRGRGHAQTSARVGGEVVAHDGAPRGEDGVDARWSGRRGVQPVCVCEERMSECGV